MIEVLSKSDNPKHRNSKFLRFLKKLGTGAYTIENEQLVKQPEKLLEFKKQEEARLLEEKSRPVAAMPEEEKMDKQKMFERLWNNEDGLNEEQFNEMMAQWEQENNLEDYNEQFANEWGKQWQ